MYFRNNFLCKAINLFYININSTLSLLVKCNLSGIFGAKCELYIYIYNVKTNGNMYKVKATVLTNINRKCII